MSEELVFANEDDALQHLANLTGKRIKVASHLHLKDNLMKIYEELNKNKQFIDLARLIVNTKDSDIIVHSVANSKTPEETDAELAEMHRVTTHF